MKNKRILLAGICVGILFSIAVIVIIKAVNPAVDSGQKELLTSDVWISEEKYELTFFESSTGNFDDGERTYAFRWDEKRDADGSVSITLYINVPGVGTQIRSYKLSVEENVPVLVGEIEWDGVFTRVCDKQLD